MGEKIRGRLEREEGTFRADHGGRVRVCLVYPNTYPLGMANLGYQTAYRLFNELDGCVCERAFLPDPEEAEEYARASSPLLAYESQTPVRDFDLVAFSIPFENDYINVPSILGLAGLPARAAERETVPLVAVGGVAGSLNPEPLADFVDFFMVGEGEGCFAPVVELLGDLSGGRTRGETLRDLDSLEFTYVPSLYRFAFDGPVITEAGPVEGAKAVVRSAKTYDLDSFTVPESFITTPETGFGETFLAEIERGCGRGCRFCAAGFLYMPPRWRDPERVRESVRKGVEKTGKVGLVGAAVSEYPDIKGVIEYGVELGGQVTLSSLRLDVMDSALLDLLKKSGYRTVTIAPEAATPRLRSVINKGLTDEEIVDAARRVREAGLARLKVYFLVGLPTETDEDALAIAELAGKLKDAVGGTLVLSVSPFIPKPFTPFQWNPFERVETLERRMKLIRKKVAGRKGVEWRPPSAREAFAQAFIARGDRRVGAVIEAASKKGLTRALRGAGELVEGSVYRERERDEILPWDMIDHGVAKEYLWNEFRRGMDEKLTPPCDVGRCVRCGVCSPEFLGAGGGGSE